MRAGLRSIVCTTAAVALAVAPAPASGQSLDGVRAAVAAPVAGGAAAAEGGETTAVARRARQEYSVGDRVFVGTLMGVIGGPVVGAFSLCGMYPNDREGYCALGGAALGMWAGSWAGGTLGAITGIKHRGCARPSDVALRAIAVSALGFVGTTAAAHVIGRQLRDDEGSFSPTALGLTAGVAAPIVGLTLAAKSVNRCATF